VTAQRISVAAAAQLFRQHAHRIAVVAHVNPDGDAIGSGLAVVHLAHALGKTAWLSFSYPDELPESLRHMPGAEEIISPEDMPDDLDFMVVVDCGSADRMGRLANIADRVPYTLVLDHHRSNDGFGTHAVIRPHDDATAQIILDFADALEVPLTTEIAECLYSALVTDTGCFKWGSARAHLDAARLLELGIDGREITRLLLDAHPFSYLKFKSRMLERATLEPDACAGRGFVWTAISLEEYQQIRPEAASALIDELRTVQDAEVAAVFREMKPGRWTGSLRSHSDVNVADVAAEFGGGGHRRAAGFTSCMPLDKTLGKVRDILQDPPLYQGD